MKHTRTLVSAILYLGISYTCHPSEAINNTPDNDERNQKNYQKTSFNSNIKKLPGLFRGHDYKSILHALEKNPRPTKDQFETTDQFNLRIEKWGSIKIYGDLTKRSRIAFVIDTSTGSAFNAKDIITKYNADTLDMTVQVSPSCNIDYGFIIHTNTKRLGSYIGENSFGARKIINRSQVNYYCIITNEKLEHTFKVKIPTNEAKQAMLWAKLLVIGKLDDQPINTDSYIDTRPTIQNPFETIKTTTSINLNIEEVWLFNNITGEILSKYNTSMPKDFYTLPENNPYYELVPNGTWLDVATQAKWSIFSENYKWKMTIQQSDGSILAREIVRTGKFTFEWMRDKTQTGNSYTINDDGSLSLHHGNKLLETMLPVPK